MQKGGGQPTGEPFLSWTGWPNTESFMRESGDKARSLIMRKSPNANGDDDGQGGDDYNNAN